MKISVIVPAFNEEKLIASTLASIRGALESFAARGWGTEIVVCDNNSTDATAELARAAGAVVVFERVNQIGRARNAGAAAAAGDWLVFVDADSRPSAALFAEVAGQIESGRCAGGGCTVRLDESHFSSNIAMYGWNAVSRICRWAAGSFIYCDKAAFTAVGGFNLELYASEELEFSGKMKMWARQNGRKFVILHRHPLLTSARKVHLYSRGEWLGFLRKAIFKPRLTVGSREACSPWYDGRR